VDLNALYSTTRERTLRQKLSVFLSDFAFKKSFFYNELFILVIRIKNSEEIPRNVIVELLIDNSLQLVI